MRTAKALIILCGCPAWSESSLDAHVILLVLSCSCLSGNRCKICFSWTAFSCLKSSLVTIDIYISETSVCTEWKYELRFGYFSLKHKHKTLSLWYVFTWKSVWFLRCICFIEINSFGSQTYQIHYILSDAYVLTEGERSEFIWHRTLFM